MKLFPCSVFVLILSKECTESQHINKKKLALTASANNQFALDLLKTLYVPDTSLFFCPFSISMMLAMIALGARGDTLKEISAAFHLDRDEYLAITLNQLQKVAQDLKLFIETGNRNYTLASVNNIIHSSDFQISLQYSDKAKKYYMNVLADVNFEKEKFEKTINTWIEDISKGKISTFFNVGSFDESTLLVLFNFAVFKGQWNDKFLAEETEDREFYLTPTFKKKLKMLHGVKRLSYFKDTERNWEVLRLPYEENNAADMIIIVPKQGGLTELVTSLNWNILNELLSQLQERKMMVKIPKMKLHMEYNLKEHLMKLGINYLFTKSANLSGMSHNFTFISNIKHTSYLEVDEEGTVAYSVTGSETVTRAQFPTFKANRPFLFLIAENIPNRRALFVGLYNRPS